MNILVTGANGQLGNEMRALSAENGQHTYFFTDVQELDICDEQAIRAFVSGNRRCKSAQKLDPEMRPGKYGTAVKPPD